MNIFYDLLLCGALLQIFSIPRLFLHNLIVVKPAYFREFDYIFS